MRLSGFDPRTVGRELTEYGSVGVSFSVLARLGHAAQLGCLRLRRGGALGPHPAPVAQLFAVVEGGGWVRSGDGERMPVEAGQAVFWEAGEEHEAGADGRGMTVVVLEADGLQESG